MPKPIFTQILSQTNTTAVNLCNNTCFCAISIKWVESCTILGAAALHAGESSKWIPLQTLKLQMHHIVHVCSQRVWECKSRNAVTLKQPPLDTVATIQLSLWWEDENKEKSDDKYKLRARLYRISCFLNTVIYLFICLFSGDSNQTDGVTWFRLGRLSCLPRREGSASWTSCLLGLPQA